jgi:hypothetical protein
LSVIARDDAIDKRFTFSFITLFVIVIRLVEFVSDL